MPSFYGFHNLRLTIPVKKGMIEETVTRGENMIVLLIPIVIFLAFLLICALMTTGEPLNPTRPLMSYNQARDYARKLQKLIACQTVSSKDGYDDREFAKLRAVMEEQFPLVHRSCKRMTFGDDCWVYMLPGMDDRHNIMLMSHHDVAPAEGEWQHPPFSGVIADGKLWGRGTVDTKTSLFAIFSALEELLAEDFMPKCNVWIASSHNEEIAGDGIPLAAAYFRDQGITFDFVLDEGGAVIDPPISGMNCAKCAMVAIHEKGRHKLVLTAEAGSAHAGLTSGMKATPTERMAEFIAAFRRENIFIRKMSPELERMLRAMAPYMNFSMKLVFANLWLFKPLLVKLMPKISPQAGGLLGTTCSFNDLITEENGKRCTAQIMLRCINDEDLKQDLRALMELARKYGISVRFGGESEYHAPADPTLPAYDQISRCIRSVFPDVPVIPFILPAGTDARTLTELCPCVLRFAPIRLTAQQLASVHSENENVDISAIGTAVVFYRRVLESCVPGELRQDVDIDFDDEFEDEYEDEPESGLPGKAVEETPAAPAETSEEQGVQKAPEDPGDALAGDTDEDLLSEFSEYTLDDLSEFHLDDFENWEDLP